MTNITDAALELASVLSLSAVAVIVVMGLSWLISYYASHPIDEEEKHHD